MFASAEHGAFTVSGTPFDRMEVADYAAESVIAARALGSIVHISGSDVTDLDTAFDLK